MDELEITWELVSQLNDDELQELLQEEAELNVSAAQLRILRQLIQIAGNLDAALELLEEVSRSEAA